MGVVAVLVAAVALQAAAWPAAQVPLPAGVIRVSEGQCPDYLDGGACLSAIDGRIYLGETRGSWRRTRLAHELGHVYDQRHLDNSERQRFLIRLGYPHLPWGDQRTRLRNLLSGEEYFADFYGACLRGSTVFAAYCPLIASFK